MDIPLKAEHSTVSYFLHHDQCGRRGEREEKEEQTTAQAYMLCVAQPHNHTVSRLFAVIPLYVEKKSRLRELKNKKKNLPHAKCPIVL